MSDVTTILNQGLSGAYVLDRPIGEGGMATVYLAQDLKHQRPVALKVLKPELAQSLGPERFRREITTAARLQHPHILSVHDSGETQGQFWFTMPFVDGESLRERLKREGRLAVDDALRITREAAQALQYAHERGIIHRDIKPENLLLTRDGFTLVADFGIARALGADGAASITGEQLTQTGTSIGTPTYMAPEQATGERQIDARVDQYSLAATLYEMLAGEPPFKADTAAALIAKRFSTPTPSVRTKRPEVPALVDQALQQALSLRAADRFPTVQEFSRAATQVISTPSTASTAALSSIPSPVATPAVPAPRRWLPYVAAIAMLAAGGAFLLRRSPAPAAQATATPAASVTRLAVLPFENRGDTADAYVAEGIADELRGKLTTIPGLEVIARGSSVQYRGTTKSQREIASELGVRYLLTGTVRWETSGGGRGRVRVSPELIDEGPSGAPASKWQQPFDAPLTDVFQVQGDIAGKVASALDVALGAGEQQRLAAQPTQNLAAYQAYLQGEALTEALSLGTSAAVRPALQFYERAVSLDSTFALAWARLSRARSLFYFNGQPSAELASAARTAAERALALGTSPVDAHLALGSYHTSVSGELDKGAAEFGRALELDARNADALVGLSRVEQALGRWDSVVAHLRQANELDPRSKDTIRRLARALVWTRRYAEAEAAADRGLAIAPTNTELLETRVMVPLNRGDLAGARGLIRAAPAQMPRRQMLADFGVVWDLSWVLDDGDQRELLSLAPGDFDLTRATWAIMQAQAYSLRGDQARARAQADTARMEFARQLRDVPDDAQTNVMYGLALAYLGQKADAVAAADKGIVLTGTDVGFTKPYLRFVRARLLVLTGDHDRAVAELSELVATPFYISRDWLRIDPNFAPLRTHPGFRKLVGGG